MCWKKSIKGKRCYACFLVQANIEGESARSRTEGEENVRRGGTMIIIEKIDIRSFSKVNEIVEIFIETSFWLISR